MSCFFFLLSFEMNKTTHQSQLIFYIHRFMPLRCHHIYRINGFFEKEKKFLSVAGFETNVFSASVRNENVKQVFIFLCLVTFMNLNSNRINFNLEMWLYQEKVFEHRSFHCIQWLFFFFKEWHDNIRSKQRTCMS